MEINDITYQIRGAAYAVYAEFGPGLLESVYQAAMIFELRQRGLSVKKQQPIPVYYRGHRLDVDFRLDLLVEDAVIVELKSVSALKEVHFKQTLTYLKLCDKRVGYLINFNTHNILESMHRIANNA